MGDTVRISRALYDRIVAEAAGSSHEVCGLLFGSGLDVTRAAACANVHATPATVFEIDPAALIAALRAERAGGPRVLGWYHSHPAGDARPSPRDAADAAPDGRVWLITDGATVTAWRTVRDGAVHGRFDPVTLVVSDACARVAASPQAPT